MKTQVKRAGILAFFAGVLAAVILLPGVSFGAIYVPDVSGDVSVAAGDISGIGFTQDADNYYFSMSLNGAINQNPSGIHTAYFIAFDTTAGGGWLANMTGVDYMIRVFHDSSKGDKVSTSTNQSGIYKFDASISDWDYDFSGKPTVNFSISDDRKTLGWVVSRNDLFLPGIWEFAGLTHSSSGNPRYDHTPMTPTPIPGAAWLLGSGLVGLIGLKRRTRKT